MISEREKMLEEQKSLDIRLNSIAEEEEYTQKQKKLLESSKNKVRGKQRKSRTGKTGKKRGRKNQKQDKENSQPLSYNHVDSHKYDNEFQDLVDSVEKA